MSNNTSNSIFARYALLDALHHEAPAIDELKSTKRLLLRSLYHSVLFKAIFIVAACVLLIVLPFMEHKSSFTALTNHMHKEELAPAKNKLLVTSLIIELFFLGVLTIDVILRGVVLFPRPYEKFCASYVVTYCAYTAALVISWICLFGSFLTLAESVSSLDALTFIRQLVRPMFLIVQASMMRKGLKAIFYSSLQLISILLLLFIVIFVFMMLGFAVFPRHLHSAHFGQSNIVADTDTVEEGETYFNSSTDTFWYLLVYLSTANSPDFGTPAYNNHRAYFVYFGIFFFVTSYLILKVISAFYALRFLYFLKESMKRTNEHRKECFEEAFKALENGNFVKVQTIRNITVSDMNLIDEGSFRLLCVSMSVRLNTLNENELKINKDKFNSLLSKIFSCHMPLQEDKRNFYAIGISNINKKCTATYLCVKFVTDLVSLPFAVIQFIYLTILLIDDYDNSLTNPRSTMVNAMLAFSCLFFPEFFVRFFLLIGHFIWPSNSFKDFDVKKLCRIVLKWLFLGHNLRSDAATKRFLGFLVDFFDCLQLFSIIVLGFIHVPCLNKGTYDDCFGLWNLIRIIQVTIVLVIFRMFRMLAKIPTFAIVFKSLLHILILFVPLMLLGYLFYYEFAVIGMAIFRGVNLNDTTAASDCGSYENLNYHPYNFEDFGSSLVVLWNLMIVNNWHIIVDAYVRRMSPYVRIYFVIWWLFTETILNGVLFGFLLEILSQATKSYFDLMQKVKDSKSFMKKLHFIFEHYIWWGENCEMNVDLSFEMSWNIYDIIEHKEEMKDLPL